MRTDLIYENGQASLVRRDRERRRAFLHQRRSGERLLRRRAKRICAAGIALASILLAGVSAQEAEAQCAGLPHLTVSSTHCPSLTDCTLEIMVSTAGYEIGSLSARVESTGAVSCGDTCNAGASASGGFCFINGLGCRINVADLAPPIVPFVDGPAARVPFTCQREGIVEVLTRT